MIDVAERLAARWGYGPGHLDLIRIAAVATAVVAGVAAALFLFAGRVSREVGLIAAAAWLAALLAWGWLRTRGELRGAGTARVAPGEVARVENLVEALAGQLGILVPRLRFVAGEAPNALVVPGRRATIALTEAAVTGLGRTELEAVLACSLIRGSGRRALMLSLSSSLGRLAPSTAAAAAQDDVATAAVTRYPPALAAAVKKCDEKSGRAAALWFGARSPAHVPREQRLSLIEDL